MQIDSLDELKVAFARWRQAKRHVREEVPEDLLARARVTAEAYGVKETVQAVRLERSRILRCRGRRAKAELVPARPTFSRLERRHRS